MASMAGKGVNPLSAIFEDFSQSPRQTLQVMHVVVNCRQV